MSKKLKVLIMTSKLATALAFGAFIGVGAPAFGITPETPATISVQQEEPGWLGKMQQIGGQIIESGKEKIARFGDPDVEVRQLRYKNAELERRIYDLERQKSDKEVMMALDYNQAMMCLGNIESLLKGYRPTILNPSPKGFGLDRAVTPQDLINQAASDAQSMTEEVPINGE